MKRYKGYSYEQGTIVTVLFKKQIVPGTFENTLHHLIDSELDLSTFDARYRNDKEGAPAYDPRILLKIIIFAYSRGIFTSREITQACNEQVMFMALSACICPHFTTIANFISQTIATTPARTITAFLKLHSATSEFKILRRTSTSRVPGSQSWL